MMMRLRIVVVEAGEEVKGCRGGWCFSSKGRTVHFSVCKRSRTDLSWISCVDFLWSISVTVLMWLQWLSSFANAICSMPHVS